MNFLIPSSTYTYLKIIAPFSPTARRALAQVSGVEPTLFLSEIIVDWLKRELSKARVQRILRPFIKKELPLTNGTHGVRLHGLFSNRAFSARIDYLQDPERAEKLLLAQIFLLKELAEIAGAKNYPAILNIHLGGRAETLAENIKLIKKIFLPLFPVAHICNVIINFETIALKNRAKEFGGDLSEFGELVKELGGEENWGITFDISHTLIQYNGDYQKIKEDLVKYNLLPRINYLHLVVPHWRYQKHNSENEGLESKYFAWEMFQRLLVYQADSHHGLLPWQKKNPWEIESWLDLVDFLVKNSRVATSEFNVVNFEVGPNFWGTDKGAGAKDILYTLDKIRQKLKTKI